MQVPKLGNEAAAQTSLALVCKLMDALVAKGAMTRAEVDGLFDSVTQEFENDRRFWADGLAKTLKARPKG